MDEGSKSAKILVVFLVAIFAFGISNCVALLTNEFINLDFPNSVDSNSSNIFEINNTPKKDSPKIYYNDSNTNNESNNVNDNRNNDNVNVNDVDNEPLPELKPPQDNTQVVPSNYNLMNQ